MLVRYKFICLSVLFWAVNTAYAQNCQMVDVDTSSTPIFLQFSDPLPLHSYAFIVTDNKNREKLIPKDQGYETTQEHGKLYLIVATVSIQELADFAIAGTDSKEADFIHNPLPRLLQGAHLDGISDATVCVLTF